jgi:hypothetical protein
MPGRIPFKGVRKPAQLLERYSKELGASGEIQLFSSSVHYKRILLRNQISVSLHHNT